MTVRLVVFSILFLTLLQSPTTNAAPVANGPWKCRFSGSAFANHFEFLRYGHDAWVGWIDIACTDTVGQNILMNSNVTFRSWETGQGISEVNSFRLESGQFNLRDLDELMVVFIFGTSAVNNEQNYQWSLNAQKAGLRIDIGIFQSNFPQETKDALKSGSLTFSPILDIP